MPNTEVVQLQIPSSAEYITVARKAIEGIGSRLPLTPQQVEDLKLAVGEACTNAVKFSGPGRPAIRITYTIRRKNVEILVRNRGRAFSRKRYRPVKRPSELLSEGGMGLYLIDQVMDEVNIHSRSGITTVRMVKRLS